MERKAEMSNYRSIERQFFENLRLERRPVAITFRGAPPSGVSKFTGTEPAGCSFWRIAAEGRTFYTVPSDHYNCAIGSYTQHLAPRGPRPGAPRDPLPHDWDRLHQERGDSRDPPTGAATWR